MILMLWAWLSNKTRKNGGRSSMQPLFTVTSGHMFVAFAHCSYHHDDYAAAPLAVYSFGKE